MNPLHVWISYVKYVLISIGTMPFVTSTLSLSQQQNSLNVVCTSVFCMQMR